MPGFANDDTQEVSSPYSYVNQDPAAQLSSNYTGGSGGSVGYGGGYQSSPGSGNANPTGYSNGPGSGTKNADTSGSGTKAPSSSMVDNLSGSGGDDDMSGRRSKDALKSPAIPAIIDHETGQTIELASKDRKTMREAQQKLAGLGLYNGRMDGLFGPKTKKATETFQNLWNSQYPNDQITVDGYIGIAPPGIAQTGDRLNQAYAMKMANRSGYVAASPPAVVSPVAPPATAIPQPVPRPASPLEALSPGIQEAIAQRGTGDVPSPAPSLRQAGVVQGLEGMRRMTAGMQEMPGGPTSALEAAAPAPRGANEAPGVGVVSTLRPDINQRYPVASDMPAHEEAIKAIIAPYANVKLTGSASATLGRPVGTGANAPGSHVEALAPLPDYGRRSADARRGPVRINQGPELTRGAPVTPPVAAAPNYVITPHSLNSGVARGAPVPAPPVSPLEATAPPAPADRYTSELEKLRQTYGLQPGDNVGPGEAPAAPPTAQEAGFLADAKASIAAGRYEPGPKAYGIGPITPGGGGATPAEATPASRVDDVMSIMGLGKPAAAVGSGDVGRLAAANPNYPGGASNVANVNEGAPVNKVYTDRPGDPQNQGPELVGSEPGVEAHAANVKQVSDMMANQPPEKQQEIADHVLIFAHAASLVADAPPEQRAAAFDEQLTRLRDVGAIDGATYDKLHGTTPTDAQLRQMIDLGNAIHEMQGGAQSSLEGARGVQVADAGNVDSHGLPLRTQEERVFVPDIWDTDTGDTFRRIDSKTGNPVPGGQYKTREQFDFMLRGESPEKRDQLWQQFQERDRSLDNGETPTSDMGGRRQVASADGGAIPGRPLQRAAAPNRAMGAPPNIWGESEDPMLDRAIDVPANPDYHYYPEPFYGGRRGGRAAV